MKIIFATNNMGKLHELQVLFHLCPIQIISQTEFQIPEIPETGLSFVENAILKARHASRETGLPAIADDSGLIVDALQGAPGIYSARYAGDKATSADNIKKLLKALENVPENKRSARYYCVLAFLQHENDPIPLICEGSWEGMILKQPQGTGGFGYDPIFFDPKENASAAELTLTQKNQVSHRGKAFKDFSNKINNMINMVFGVIE